MMILSVARKDPMKFAEYWKLWILNTSHVSRMSWVNLLVRFNFSFTNHSAIEVPESGVRLATYDTREEVQGETELRQLVLITPDSRPRAGEGGGFCSVFLSPDWDHPAPTLLLQLKMEGLCGFHFKLDY